ncbi:MAG: hypothetical protein K1X57_10340 [Gemmataceae bacterium]|nr:hypothetical protein [Gemmataceae bacterium]
MRMSAGPVSTRRHAIAEYLREKAVRNQLAIDLVPNAGSEECLEQLKAGRLDVALVNNGVVVPDRKKVTVLAALQPEVVHVLVRRELSGDTRLAQRIQGKRVNLGEKGSTDWLLARELLAFGRLKLPSPESKGDIIPTELGKAELAERARAILRADAAHKQALIDELPDCLVLVVSLPSTVVQLLVEAADYRIEPLPGARAFLMDNLREGNAKSTIIDREFLEPAVVPANCYFTQQALPAADCETIGLRLLVVARKGAPDRAIAPLMRSLYESEFTHVTKPKSPRDVATPYALHTAAVAYLDRDKPLPIKEFMNWISQGLSVFGAFTAGALSLYGLLRWKKVRKPADYFGEIRRVEQLAKLGAQRSDAGQPGEDPAECLMKLREELIEDICEGRIKGDQVIANILLLLKDTRNSLPKRETANEHLPSLLLHQRSTANAA